MDHKIARDIVGQAIGHALLLLKSPELLGVAFVISAREGEQSVTIGGVAAMPGVPPELLTAVALDYYVEVVRGGEKFEEPSRICKGGGS
jgi:hypothetical protein